jgi:hypothetical protein
MYTELYKSLYKPKTGVSCHHSPSAESYEYPSDSEELPDVTYAASANGSNYESDSEEHASDRDEHASDGEENQAPASSNTSSGVVAYGNARRPLRDVDTDFRFEEGPLEDPWRPFHTLDDFKLAK